MLYVLVMRSNDWVLLSVFPHSVLRKESVMAQNVLFTLNKMIKDNNRSRLQCCESFQSLYLCSLRLRLPGVSVTGR